MEAFSENRKQIEHDLKLQDSSKTEVHKADNAKILLYPDSVLFKCWGEDLREEEQTVAQNLFLSYGYNVYLGDHLPPDQPIRVTRSPQVQYKPSLHSHGDMKLKGSRSMLLWTKLKYSTNRSQFVLSLFRVFFFSFSAKSCSDS